MGDANLFVGQHEYRRAVESPPRYGERCSHYPVEGQDRRARTEGRDRFPEAEIAQRLDRMNQWLNALQRKNEDLRRRVRWQEAPRQE